MPSSRAKTVDPASPKPVSKEELLALFKSPEFTSSLQDAVEEITRKLAMEITSLKDIIVKQDEELQTMKLEVESTKRDMSELKSQLEKNNRSTNLQYLRLDGIEKDEEAEKVIIDLAKTKMGLTLRRDEFSVRRTYPRGSSSKQSSAPSSASPSLRNQAKAEAAAGNKVERSPTVLVYFNNFLSRRSFYKGRRDLKGTGVYVSEHLTRDGSSLFYQCRQLKKKSKVTSVWTNKLSVFIKDLDGNVIPINYAEDLKSFESC